MSNRKTRGNQMAVIFAKTGKGQDEIKQRSGELTPRVRLLLIFVDGKRSVEELRNVFPADDLTHSLGLLEELELIEVGNATGQAGQDGATSDARKLPSITAFRILGDNDPTNFARARNYMENTINSFVGAVGTSSLLNRIQDAQSHTELR